MWAVLRCKTSNSHLFEILVMETRSWDRNQVFCENEILNQARDIVYHKAKSEIQKEIKFFQRLEHEQ